jgi:hypothetical protein
MKGQLPILFDPATVLKYLGVEVDPDDASARWRTVSSQILSVLMNAKPELVEDIDALLVCGMLADSLVIRQIILEHLRRWGFFNPEEAAKRLTGHDRAAMAALTKNLFEVDKNIRQLAVQALMTPAARVRLKVLSALVAREKRMSQLADLVSLGAALKVADAEANGKRTRSDA